MIVSRRWPSDAGGPPFRAGNSESLRHQGHDARACPPCRGPAARPPGRRLRRSRTFRLVRPASGGGRSSLFGRGGRHADRLTRPERLDGSERCEADVRHLGERNRGLALLGAAEKRIDLEPMPFLLAAASATSPSRRRRRAPTSGSRRGSRTGCRRTLRGAPWIRARSRPQRRGSTPPSRSRSRGSPRRCRAPGLVVGNRRIQSRGPLRSPTRSRTGVSR